MKAADFILRLQEKGRAGLGRPVLFLGEEAYWIATGINWIKKVVFPEAGEEFNLVRLDIKETEAALLGTEIAAAPFFGKNRLLILNGLEDLKPAQEEAILTALPRLAPGVFLIMTAGHLDQRKKAVKEIKAMVETVDCAPLKLYEAKRWVSQEAKARGLKLTPAQIDLLLEMKGTSLFSLDRELEKVKTYCGGEEQAVSMAEWSCLLGEASETNIFQMIDGAIEGKAGTALHLLHRLLKAGEPEMKILAMLGTEVRRLFIAWGLLQTGRSHELQKELACHPYVAEKIRKRAEGLTYLQLRQAHRRLLQADFRLKTGQADPGLELDLLILDLGSCLAGRSGATT
ncbi:MAG: DNA polymerase III subunit delta [Firmicutes bacterium]|nr:DNA polymerase III subunit delta [Bacillota bacterium]